MEDKKFNPEHMERLNHPERLNVLDPQKIWDFVDVNEVFNIVDIGAGTAFITEALYEIVPHARIDAFDIEPLMVQEMNRRLLNHNNIHPSLMKENKLPLSDEYADLVWMINLYHEIHKPYRLLREIKRVLKRGGKLLIIDWAKKPEAAESGPPIEHRVDQATLTSHLVEMDFWNIRTTEEFDNHLGVVCQK